MVVECCSMHAVDPMDVRPLRRSEYDKLVEMGAFTEEHVELLYGVVVRMSPHGPPHDSATDAVQRLLFRALDPSAYVRIQNAFAASDGSEPEPDVAVVPPADYRKEHPTRAHLVVEVADTSLERDRTVKARLYAESDVPEYWIVNVIDRVVEVHTDPSGGKYRSVVVRRRGDRIRLVDFPNVAVLVDDIFGA